ncbi:MAG TPA: cyclic nucleotide-binding domain-containing protein [Thermoanaerobaculia bacterium]|nr:cyclic nucleotide-binding domain-containing protein [Thermoanaerobaculia bacterium]
MTQFTVPKPSPASSLSRFLVSYPAGSKIYGEGDIGTELFVIRSGEVEITQTRKAETFTLARLSKGDFFGEESLLEEVPRDATARARTDVEVIRVNGAVFEQMLASNPAIAIRIMRKMLRQTRQATASLQEISGVRLTPVSGAPIAASPEGQPVPATLNGKPQLVTLDRKNRFPLNEEGDTIVGRADPIAGTTPDVDLTAFDSDRTVSRRHARLYTIGETMYVMEEIGVANGTFVNDLKLTTGAPAVLRHGDDLKLGFVTLTFWRPTA